MQLITIFTLVFVGVEVTSQEDNADLPIPTLTPVEGHDCVSIQLPWLERKMYFCTERLHYHPCNSNSHVSCKEMPPGTLWMDAPWLCCPIQAHPEHCEEVKCAPPPFNRTCSKVQEKGSCCPRYFCGEQESKDWPLCRRSHCARNSIEDLDNSTKFFDPHDCCAKIQRLEDEKPGECPPVGRPNSRFLNQDWEIGCVGDFNCPGDRKCCPRHESPDRAVHDSLGVVGYCQQPILS